MRENVRKPQHVLAIPSINVSSVINVLKLKL